MNSLPLLLCHARTGNTAPGTAGDILAGQSKQQRFPPMGSWDDMFTEQLPHDILTEQQHTPSPDRSCPEVAQRMPRGP